MKGEKEMQARAFRGSLAGAMLHNRYAIARYTIAYKVHNAIIGLTPLKVFIIAATDNVARCQNE